MVKSANIVLGTFAVLLGGAILIVGKSANLPIFSGSTPGPGFMPTVVAWGIIVCGLLILSGTFKTAPKGEGDKTEKDSEIDANMVWIFKKDDLRNFVIVIATSIMVVSTAKLLGLLISMGIGVILISKLLGTPKWLTSILVGIGSTAVFYLTFDLFLNVPLPRGIFGI